MINARGKSLADVLEQAREAVARYGVKLVVLDSLSRMGGDLKENLDANRAMDQLNSLGVAWLAIGHTPREGDHVFGSQMFDAAADVTVEVTQAQQDDVSGVRLRIKKANDIPPATEVLRLAFNEYGLAGIRRAKDGEFEELKEGTSGGRGKKRSEDDLYDLLSYEKDKGATLEQLRQGSGGSRATVQNWLREQMKCGMVAREGSGEKGDPYRYFNAIDQIREDVSKTVEFR